MTRLTTLWRHITAFAWLAIALGIATIVAGELAGWGGARLVAAALVSVGGLALGIASGIREPHRRRWRGWLARGGLALLWLLAALISLPAVLALGAAAIGSVLLVSEGAIDTISLVGLAVAAGMLAAMTAVTLVALRATRAALSKVGGRQVGSGTRERHL